MRFLIRMILRRLLRRNIGGPRSRRFPRGPRR